MRRFPLLILLGLLFGCTAAPLTVPLRDFEVGIATVQSGKVLFTRQQFDRPPVAFTSVALEGSLSYQQGAITMSFYAADAEPCAPTAGLHLCNPSDPGVQPAGSADFQSGATQPLRLSGSRLTGGINGGNLWLGVRLESGGVTTGTLRFANLVAKLAVLP